ncbi:uncharacterized protein LOC134820793 isoform X3 [Bolinopsis microptera]|uniref:uncharacterized protein LOC134820793 isoform X3 n=1 Tax=Bolinopsis microptera TaxID=2820187 RepID=UPI00307AEFE3
MGWNTLLIGCIAHLALLQTGDAECTLDRKVIVLEGNNNLKYGMECREAGEFLTTLNFRVESAALAITMEESSLCFVRGCCRSFLYSQLRRKISCSNTIDYEAEVPIKIGDSVGKCTCRASESGIVDTTARCDRFIRDGSGWNLVAAYKNGTLCGPCPGGSHLVDNICQPCDKGSYSDGAECKPCPRGRYTEGKGASECLYCPAGHTTYTHTPNTCVGPQLYHYSDSKREKKVFTALVSYETLGSEEAKAGYWGSIGNWKLSKSNGKFFAKILEKYTTSFSKGPRALFKRGVKGFEPIIEDVYCYTGDGSKYKGNAAKTKSGSTCTGPHQHCDRICRCRNFRGTHGHKKPYCERADGAQEDCDIPKCNDPDPLLACMYDRNDTSETLIDSDNPIEFGDIASAQIICDKLGGGCKGVWGKGSSWRVTGLSPTEQGNGSYEYYRKDSHCPNPYHEHYFKQIHELDI